MLLKLSLTGIKGRLRDYIVLFSGLVVASGIFYMFEAIATNKNFLENNSLVSSAVIIFHLGTVLLSIITFVYIVYANSFLMTMRQKDYAMFMMLGAKGRKIAQLIFIETFVVGVSATVVGIVLGIGLSSVVQQLLINQLAIKITHFTAISSSATVFTLLFFTAIFLLAAIVNAMTIVKKPILSLLKASATPLPANRKPLTLVLEVIAGIIFLAIGYFMMTQVMKLAFLALIVALITIILGTYFMFHSILIFVLDLLKRRDRIALKNLNNFTLAQLSFRIQDYTRILSMVAMLFALALGAITVGLGFHNEIMKMTEATTSYDLLLNNGQNFDASELQSIKPTIDVAYQQKEDANTIYYDREQFDQTPLLVKEFGEGRTIKKVQYTGERLAKDVTASDQLRSLELPDQRTKNHQFVSSEEFAALPGETTQLRLITVADFAKDKDVLKDLANENFRKNPTLDKEMGRMEQKSLVYELYNALFSGFEFMGFFLGIAFLTMLASCLMFKILSGAKSDIQRYSMLEKIGTRRKLLTQSIQKEIGILFLVPGLLGVTHVLFGLQMFKALLSEPYSNLWVPFLIFFVLYFIYYILTIWIYTGIVMKQKN
ncbi:ABC transporter permease [Tetragenococcus koreensis]|uniref:FtsX-like permease family protein n=1 Tax=Tetragenococcus koreensis TaxID=290335 RepID=UPI001F49290D|nr:ABC transporter permease [Tetragenococcus koreensis]MDN6839657.1 ABC transporter permease [Tetragenococcus halophilus]MCF1586185.1 ABC transporter permease [Tetragenococcus koreensis]MCF1615755.1 ABC transporter permease [Tetragenococcus koreensis]MCF1625551.1 ABC transporter permease [Tetragenococcus koreensis]MCF1630443.1 ABC transporter permease [Tetragenococcus koreensis]